MSILEVYLLLLSDVFVERLLIIVTNPYILQTMQEWGVYDKQMMLAAAALGAFLAVVLNYGLGMIISSIGKLDGIPKENEVMLGIRKIAQRYGFFVVLLGVSLSVFGILINCMAGYYRIKFSHFFIAAAINVVGYYYLAIM